MFNLNLDVLGVSTEDIKFQGLSDLSIDLIKFYQTWIDKKHEMLKEKTDIYNEFSKEFKNKAHLIFTDIVKKHTGLSVNFIDYSDFGMGEFACYMFLGNADYEGNETAHEITKAYSANTKSPDPMSDISDDYASMLDLEGGFVNNTKKLNINVAFIFDIRCAFFTEEAGASRDFSSPEIASIMIHEIGHMYSMLEHSADRIVRHNSVIEFAGKVGESNDDKLTRLETISKKLRKAQKDAKVKSKTIDTFLTMSEVVIELPKKHPNIFARFGHTVLALVGFLITMMTMIYINIFILPLRVLIGDLGSAPPKPNGKVSDLGYNEDTIANVEKYADAFVTRHGLGKYSITSLDLLYGLTPMYGRGKDVKTAVALTKASMFIMTAIMGEKSYIYEDGFRRAKRVMQNSLKALKSTKASPEVMDIFIKDYERISKAFDNAKSSKKQQTTLPIWMNKYLSLPALLAFIMRGNNDKEYMKFQRDLEDLANTKLFYQAAKIKQLARK